MTAASSSGLLLENVNKILSTFVPAHANQDTYQLLTSIGVKSHGTITFPDNKSNRAQFIRIPPEASVTHVKELLSRVWCNGRPSLVISVTGGAKEYNMKAKLLGAFRRGLFKVARTTGAWIITGGMNTGIMKLVGEIVQLNPDRSRPIHLIGIGTWGCVSGCQDLDVHGSTVQYTKSRSDKKGEASLQPNHTEFIFIDDGSERKYGREIAFRAKLEQAISGGFFASKHTSLLPGKNTCLRRNPSVRLEHADPVPVVLIVVEGGPNTVRTVHEAVVQNNIPAVFFEGTGRCCDLFAKAVRLYKQYCSKFDLGNEISSYIDPNTSSIHYDDVKNKLREELKNELLAISGGSNAANPDKSKRLQNDTAATTDRPTRSNDKVDYFELVYECVLTRTNFLNVISLNSRYPVEPDIDLVILQALLNATSGSDMSKTNIQRKREQLHLALEWNRVDVAKNCIMKNDRDWENIDLNDLFSLALERDQVEFVKLFLDHDFSLTDLFRDNKKLLTLYMNEMKIDTLSNSSTDPLRTIYKKILQPLIGDFFDVNAALPPVDLSPDNQFTYESDDETCPCCEQRNYHSPSRSPRHASVTSEGSTTTSGGRIDVDKELFFWSVVAGRQEFALLFWSRGKNKICAALIAILFYKKHAHKENDQNYDVWANEFENLAVQILDKFYAANPHACTKAIIRKIPAYGNVTWLELAVAAEAKQFIAQRAVQDVLNNIWFGYIDQRVSDTAIIFSTFMLWYSGFLRYHNELVKLNEETTLLDGSLNRVHGSRNQILEEKRTTNRPVDAVRLKLLPGATELDTSPVEFIDIGCWEKTRTRISRYFNDILTFVHAPYVKYLYNVYFHVAFLLLFSYVILCDFFPLYDFPNDACVPIGSTTDNVERATDTNGGQPDVNRTLIEKELTNSKLVLHGFQRHRHLSITEFILFVWVFTLACEEIRQLLSTEAQSRRNAIIAYFKVFWNKLDVLAIILFYMGFTLRLLPSSECFCAARIILSVDLTIWFIRSLDIFAAVKQLGPKLVMIGEMAHDLKFFMLMLTVFILAFGVSSYALIYGVEEFSWHLPRKIVNFAYWQIFGELNALEAFEFDYKPNGYAAFILLIAYMAVASILLVNLLIAMFSNTFDRLQSDTDRIWKFQRYSLVCEYLSRPALPPPLILFSHLWRCILCILARCCKSSRIQGIYALHTNRTKFKLSLDERNATNIEIAEDAFGDEIYYSLLKQKRKLLDEAELDEERVQTPQQNILNRIRTLENRIQTMYNQQSHMFEYLECLVDSLRVMAGDRIKVPEKCRFDPEESFDEFSSNAYQTKQNHHRESLCSSRSRSSSIVGEHTPTTFDLHRDMSENNQISTQSTTTNNNNSTSDTTPSLVPFTLKRWNLVGIWSWDVAHDVCAICRTALSESCLRCQAASNLQECIIVWGTCNHSFHNCCMSQWIKQRAQCPLCQTDWVINRIGQ